MTNTFLSVWFNPFLENLPLPTDPANGLWWHLTQQGPACAEHLGKSVEKNCFLYNNPWCRHRETKKEEVISEHTEVVGRREGELLRSSQPVILREDGMKENVGTTHEREMRPYPVRPGFHKSPASPPSIRFSSPGPDISILPWWSSQSHL